MDKYDFFYSSTIISHAQPLYLKIKKIFSPLSRFKILAICFAIDFYTGTYLSHSILSAIAEIIECIEDNPKLKYSYNFLEPDIKLSGIFDDLIS